MLICPYTGAPTPLYRLVGNLAEKIRKKTGLKSDGTRLVQEALAGRSPMLRINALASESHRSEQHGFATLLAGMFGTFRNPTAHAPRISWPMSEEDALDLFTLASYTHRRLDGAGWHSP